LSRRPNLDRPVRLSLKLPETVRVKLDLLLFSSLEGRVPKGGYQEFFIERIQEYLSWRRTDLTPFGLPGYYVAGPREMIEALERKLKEGERDSEKNSLLPYTEEYPHVQS